MNRYTFVLRVEIAESSEGNTEDEAREALVKAESNWMISRPNGAVLEALPHAIPIHELQKDEDS